MTLNHVVVALDDATDRQILIALVRAVQRLEDKVSELSTSVDDLRVAVADLSGRVTGQIVPLQEALASAQQTLADFTLADEIEDADFARQINELKAELESKMQEAADAANGIQEAIDNMGEIAPHPPAPEDPPVVDNTLPNELPTEGEPPVVNPL